MAAEVIYVDDMVNLGIRSNPRSGDAPLKVVTTGMKLTVLATDGNYLKVRAEDGTEGWVNKYYTSETIPARARIEGIEAENNRLSEALAKSDEQVESLRKALASAETKASDLTNKNSELRARLSEYEASEEDARYQFMLKSAGLLILFLLGMVLGIQWYKKRIGQRIGGLEF